MNICISALVGLLQRQGHGHQAGWLTALRFLLKHQCCVSKSRADLAPKKRCLYSASTKNMLTIVQTGKGMECYLLRAKITSSTGMSSRTMAEQGKGCRSGTGKTRAEVTEPSEAKLAKPLALTRLPFNELGSFLASYSPYRLLSTQTSVRTPQPAAGRRG